MLLSDGNFKQCLQFDSLLKHIGESTRHKSQPQFLSIKLGADFLIKPTRSI